MRRHRALRTTNALLDAFVKRAIGTGYLPQKAESLSVANYCDTTYYLFFRIIIDLGNKIT